MALTDKELAEMALEATKRSYSPYSKFPVGAALETDAGVFTGANVENRSYGLTVCAERAAVFAAVTAGARRFRRLAVATPGERHIPPCGACLQVLSEFCTDLDIILVNGKKSLRRRRLKALYPQPFKLKK